MSKNNARRRQRSNHFSQIPNSPIQRSIFDRSHDYKTTMDAGYLIPFFVDEVLPGDTFKLRVNAFVRMNTLVAPFMDNVFMDTFFFFVPTRLVWDNWQRFCGEQKNPGDSTDFLIPCLNMGSSFSNGSIYDYMGLPTNVNLDYKVTPINALPFRCYNLIYNEWFRDENLIDSVTVNTGDGPDNLDLYKLQRRAKRHDYFTSCLPWPQKGPQVDINLASNSVVPVEMWSRTDPDTVLKANWNNGVGIHFQGDINYASMYNDVGGDFVQRYSEANPNVGTGLRAILSPNVKYLNHNNTYGNGYANDPYVSWPSIEVNDLRQAFQIQKFYEKWARGGSRYTETLRVMFNVISPDARLQRPEYIGGTHSRINVVPTAQTSSTDSVSPQSNLSAFGVLGDSAHGFNKSFVEHGYVIGLCCLRADITYQQGLNRMWSRRQLFDFYWPTLAHLGEQVVYNKEIYTQGTAEDNGVFGYQERYAEYRYKPSMITGKLRSTDPQSLDVWHLAQKFDSLPKLNQDFIEENPPINRVIAVQNEPQFFADFWFDLKTSRPMPVYSVPGLVDHF